MSCKPLVFILTIICCTTYCTAQTPFTDTGKLASLCKVWGFLKYYHPAVASGDINWDAELINKIRPVLNAKDKEELNIIYAGWINSLGPAGPPVLTSATHTTDNSYLTWTTTDEYFTDDVRHLIRDVVQHRHTGSNHYAVGKELLTGKTFKNELTYDSLQNPGREMRLLALARYWNIVEYYFPSKYMIGEDWQNVLTGMIPRFYFDTSAPYQQALAELTARIHDSHGWYASPADTLLYRTPFAITIIEGKALVMRITNDSLARIDDIRQGDIITAVNNVPVSTCIAEHRKYINYSNENGALRNLAYACICRGADREVTLSLERNGASLTKVAHRYPAAVTNAKDIAQPHFKMLNENIGYVNMGILKPREVKKMYKMMAHTKAVIFDTRNYPQGTMYGICEHFGTANTPFVKIVKPDFTCPGTFVDNGTMSCGPGRKKKGYQGRIIVLMNELTQSHAEFTCMSFKTLPNVTFIGSQTAGADGNVSNIIFPGGSYSGISGIGIYYPDGKPTQRIGIVPDIEARPTIAGVQAGKDEVLDRALAFINEGK